jgi:hypothetical protein
LKVTTREESRDSIVDLATKVVGLARDDCAGQKPFLVIRWPPRFPQVRKPYQRRSLESMKTILPFIVTALLLSFFIPLQSRADTPILSGSEATHHVGQHATVEGTVMAVTTSKEGNTSINFGGVYPNQTFTGWIPAETPVAGDPTIHSLKGQTIKITGLIELYRGKPEIRIFTADQIAGS